MNFKHNMAHVMLFYLELGGMLIVKWGVGDHQQALPSYPFARPEQRCGFSMLDQELLQCNALQKLIYKPILSLELSKIVLEIHR